MEHAQQKKPAHFSHAQVLGKYYGISSNMKTEVSFAIVTYNIIHTQISNITELMFIFCYFMIVMIGEILWLV